MSKIHYRHASFEELARGARIVVVVRKTGNEHKRNSISVRRLLKTYKPYTFPVAEFEVVKRLRGDGITPGNVIEVYPAKFDRKLELHRRYVIERLSKSPIYAAYQPKVYKPEDDTFLLFLTRTRTRDGTWRIFVRIPWKEWNTSQGLWRLGYGMNERRQQDRNTRS